MANMMRDPEAGHQELYLDEKSTTQFIAPEGTSIQSKDRRTCFKMPRLRSCLIAIVVAAFCTFACGSAIRQPMPIESTEEVEVKVDQSTFERLLEQVSDIALHNVLHKHTSYKHGVYTGDRQAVQAIHDENPAVGTGLVELARRQNTNGTTSSTAVTTPTTTLVSTSTEPATTETSTEAPTTTAPATTQPTSTEPTVSSTSLSTPSSTTETTTAVSNSSSPTIASTTSANPTTTQSTSAQTTTSSAAVTSSTAVQSTLRAASTTLTSGTSTSVVGGTTTSSAEQTSAAQTTSAASSSVSSKSEEVVYTTTLPNGAVSTVTYVTVVPYNSQASTPGVTATGSPSLQNGADRRTINGMGVGAGIVAIVMAL